MGGRPGRDKDVRQTGAGRLPGFGGESEENRIRIGRLANLNVQRTGRLMNMMDQEMMMMDNTDQESTSKDITKDIQIEIAQGRSRGSGKL